MLTLRLDDETEQALERIAHRLGKSKSAVVRAAIAEILAREQGSPTLYDKISHLVGTVDGPGDLSATTGKKVRESLRGRKRPRGRR